MRHGGVPAPPLDSHVKLDGAGHEGARPGAHGAGGQRGPHVHAKGGLHAVQRACRGGRRRAMVEGCMLDGKLAWRAEGSALGGLAMAVGGCPAAARPAQRGRPQTLLLFDSPAPTLLDQQVASGTALLRGLEQQAHRALHHGRFGVGGRPVTPGEVCMAHEPFLWAAPCSTAWVHQSITELHTHQPPLSPP